MGLADQPGFGRYHEVLNRARWDARDFARRLLLHLLATLSPSGEVVIGIDDTIERRWGAQNQSARHLSRCGAIVAWPLRQDQRSTLVVTGGDATGPVCRPTLGLTVPDGAGAVGALERGAREAAQSPDRLSKTGDPANQTLAAGSPCGGRRRQPVLGLGADRRCTSLRLLHHQAASRRQFVRAGTETPERPNGTACTERQSRPKLNAVLTDPKTVWTSVLLTEWSRWSDPQA